MSSEDKKIEVSETKEVFGVSAGGSNAPPTPEKPIFTPDSLKGLAKDAAVKLAGDNGFKTRITSEDGKSFMGTMDFVNDRLNLEVNDGKVVSVKKG